METWTPEGYTRLLENEVERQKELVRFAREGLRRVIFVGSKPYAGMGRESARELRGRGQRMVNEATDALNRGCA